MPVLSRGVVSRTFGAPAACCCLLLLLLLKRVAQPWPLKGGVKPRQGKPSSVLKCHLFQNVGSPVGFFFGLSSAPLYMVAVLQVEFFFDHLPLQLLPRILQWPTHAFACLRAVGFEPGTFRLQVQHAYLSPTQCHGLGIRPYTLCIRPYTHRIRPYTPGIRPCTASIRPYTCLPIPGIGLYTRRYTAVYSEV